MEFDAFTTDDPPRRHRFRSLAAIARRLGGSTWELDENDESTDERIVHVVRGRGRARTVVVTLRVPAAAVAAAHTPQAHGRISTGTPTLVRLSDDQISALDHLAAHRGTSRVAVIRDAIDAYLHAQDG